MPRRDQQSQLQNFPSDKLLELLMENEIHLSKQTGTEVFEENPRVRKGLIRDKVLGIIKLRIWAADRKDCHTHQALSIGDMFTVDFATELLLALAVAPQYEEVVLETLYRDLQAAARQSSVTGQVHVFTFDDAVKQFFVRPFAILQQPAAAA